LRFRLSALRDCHTRTLGCRSTQRKTYLSSCKHGKGRIDVFRPDTLLTEQKSAGQDLNTAYTQATDYFDSLSDSDMPCYVLVSDFHRFRSTISKTTPRPSLTPVSCTCAFRCLVSSSAYRQIKVRDEDPLNIKAVQLLGEVHETLKKHGYGLD
jgi:hypothetical protein